MVAYLLNVVYFALLLAVSPWLLWSAVRKEKYRAGWGAKLLGRVPLRKNDRPCIWLHAVSVGEVNLLAPLLAELERRRPECEFVISTTTKTGYALAQKRYSELTVFYCPLDFSWAVRRALRRVRPELLILAELELWPNLVRAAREQGAQIAIINGRLSEKSFRGYRRIRPLVARLLQQVDLIAAQNEEYAERFRLLGARPTSVVVTGSLKFDGAETNRENARTQQLRTLAGFANDEKVFLAGSTQDPEERLTLEAYRELRSSFPGLRLVLVPRHPERFDEVAELLTQEQVPFRRRSRLQPGEPLGRDEVLLVDVVGELGAWWGTAAIAYVGGSLSRRGGQNMIEPAAYGAAVCFGPNTWNFRDIVAALRAADAAVVVHDGAELTAFVRQMLAEPEHAAERGERAARLVRSQLGATQRTVDQLEMLLEMQPAPARRAA